MFNETTDAQVRDAMHLPKKSQEKRDKENKDKQKKEKDDKKKQDQKDKEQKKKKQEQEEAHAAVEMTEEEVAAAREEALGKLETPLEKMKIKDLLKLLEERGVECKNCKGAEKAHIVSQVREAIHLPKKSKGSKKKSEGKGGKKEDVDDIMSKLKGMPGMENIKVLLCPPSS